VTLLPGGPEDPSAGARGSVVKVHPWNGTVQTVATGFAGATDLAVSPRGDIYVSELFGGRISVVTRGSTEPVLWREAPTPAAVEWSPRGIYATIDALGADPEAPPAGKLVFYPF
jgi:DNA-binding beta-propeller fold protein YncE